MPGRIPTFIGINKIEFVKDISKLIDLPDQLEKKLEVIVEKAAFEIKALAQYYVPVDQGAAKASIYVVTPRISDKESSLNEAKQKAKTEESRWGHLGRDLFFTDTDPEEQQLRNLHALICVGVVYGLWLETANYTIRATNPGARKPYLTPAMLQYEKQFLKACASVFEEIR